jgi:hypothetical protein
MLPGCGLFTWDMWASGHTNLANFVWPGRSCWLSGGECARPLPYPVWLRWAPLHCLWHPVFVFFSGSGIGRELKTKFVNWKQRWAVHIVAFFKVFGASRIMTTGLCECLW